MADLKAPGTVDDVDVLIACGSFSEVARLCDELELEVGRPSHLTEFPMWRPHCSSLYAAGS